jgi:hypothetical protein
VARQMLDDGSVVPVQNNKRGSVHSSSDFRSSVAPTGDLVQLPVAF